MNQCKKSEKTWVYFIQDQEVYCQLRHWFLLLDLAKKWAQNVTMLMWTCCFIIRTRSTVLCLWIKSNNE